MWNLGKASASLGLALVIRRPVVCGLPDSIMIEPISLCNLRCPLCPIGARELKRPLGTMTVENFRRILDNVGPQLRTLALWNQGEPTLCEELPEMIRIAHDRGIFTTTSTNGTLLLRENLTDRLIESGLDELIVSVDGISQETYEHYRVGGQLSNVVSGIRALRKRRDELRRRKPRIVLQWLPMKHNEREIPHLRRTAAEWGADTVEIKTAQVYTSDQAEEYLPDARELRRYEKRGQKWETRRRYQSCRRLWFSTVIDWNGTVVACCFDKDEDYPMGNALREDFRSIWRGRTYNALRTKLLREGRALEMCRNCTEGLKTFYLPLRKIESLRAATDEGVSALEEPPVKVGGLADADARSGRN